ncbi:hypothetical protein GCM10019059_45210 [Camelimonas fluminis]|nr:hypothetical protein GCM10019059_45210 [Camelimonas fluminis]
MPETLDFYASGPIKAAALPPVWSLVQSTLMQSAKIQCGCPLTLDHVKRHNVGIVYVDAGKLDKIGNYTPYGQVLA